MCRGLLQLSNQRKLSWLQTHHSGALVYKAFLMPCFCTCGCYMASQETEHCPLCRVGKAQMEGGKWLPVSQQPQFLRPVDGAAPNPDVVQPDRPAPAEERPQLEMSVLLARLDKLEGAGQTLNAQTLTDGLLAAVRVGGGRGELTREALGPLDLLNLLEGPSHLISMINGTYGAMHQAWLIRVSDMLKRRVSIKATRDADMIQLKSICFRYSALSDASQITDDMIVSGWGLYWKLSFAAIVEEELGSSSDMRMALRVGSAWQELMPVDLSAHSLRQWQQGAGRNALARARKQARQQGQSQASQARGGKNESGGGSGGGASGSKTTPPK